MASASGTRAARINTGFGLASVLLASCFGLARCRSDAKPVHRVQPAPQSSGVPWNGSAAVARCSAAAAEIRKTPDLQQAFAIAARECSQLFRSPECRLAWLHASELDVLDSLRTIVPSCAKAYCPVLETASTLEACAAKSDSDVIDPRRAGPLFAEILRHDFGPQDATFAAQALAELFISRPPGPAAPRGTTWEIPMDPEDSPALVMNVGPGDSVTIFGMDGSVVAKTDLGHLDATLRQLAAKYPDTRMHVSAAEGVPNAKVIGTMGAARAAGITRLDFLVTP